LTNNLAWVISANMGLGHQRATYPLRGIAHKGIHLFGEGPVNSIKEQKLWNLFRESYEFLSRIRQVPLVGPPMFGLLERLQNISPYYPLKDRSKPSLQLKSLYSLIRRGMGHSLLSRISSYKLPVITSFYAAAIAAEELTDLPVYCIICDSDINRVWVAENPKKSRIIYFAPCSRALRRLKQYGVPDERIFLTGFPLPYENIGDESLSVLKADLKERLFRLDPTKRFRTIHGEEAKYYLGTNELEGTPGRPITVTYAVGGAGAQTDIGGHALNSLIPHITKGRIRLNLVAGIRSSVNDYFTKLVDSSGLRGSKNINIIYSPDINGYFRAFNNALHTTDLLWTKPSELSFYCGLGIPIIISPSIGPHEVYNSRWLQSIGSGILQEDPRYCGEWITDYLVDGRLCLSAWDGFLYARKMGIYKIYEILKTGKMSRNYSPLKR
jgi:hypothetical protein